jgi:GT2 family glycosyltransferase
MVGGGRKQLWTWRDWRRWPVTNEIRAMAYWPRDHVKARLYECALKMQALQDLIFPNSLPRFSKFQMPVNLHTNACGDFTLLSKEDWNTVRGYPELEVFSMHLDSLLCYAAHHSGAREATLSDPMRIYHIEHGSGSGWTPEGEAKLYHRIDSAGISRLTSEQLFEYGVEMRRNGRAMIFNRENWGLVDEDLPETVIGSEGNRA